MFEVDDSLTETGYILVFKIWHISISSCNRPHVC